MKKIALTLFIFAVIGAVVLMRFNAKKLQNTSAGKVCVPAEGDRYQTLSGRPVAEVMRRLNVPDAEVYSARYNADLAELVNWAVQYTPMPIGQSLPSKENIINTIFSGYKSLCIKIPRNLVKVLDELQLAEQ